MHSLQHTLSHTFQENKNQKTTPNKQQLCAQLKYIKGQKSGKELLSLREDIKPMRNDFPVSLLATKFWEHTTEAGTLMQLANAMH